jgi:hypothetical protein
LTIALVALPSPCERCAVLVLTYEDQAAHRRIQRDATTLEEHDCVIDGQYEELDRLLRCERCGEINTALTTWGRHVEWYHPFPVPPYQDHVCVQVVEPTNIVPFPQAKTPAKQPRPVWEAFES